LKKVELSYRGPGERRSDGPIRGDFEELKNRDEVFKIVTEYKKKTPCTSESRIAREKKSKWKYRRREKQRRMRCRRCTKT